MKSKFGLIRVLAIVFALVLSISLVSCVKDEDLDSVKTDAGKTQENVNQLQTDVSELKKSLETVASEIKKTADDAATKAAFESAKNALEAADSKLAEDLAAANADIEAAKTEYQAKIDAITEKLTAAETSVGNNATAIAELKTALNELKTNVGSLATKAELENYVKSADLGTAIDTKVSALETKVNASIKTVSDNLTALENKVNGMATTTDLTELTNSVKALQTAVTNLQNKKFLDDYISLTEMLNGDGEYSFKNFIDQANEVEEGPYADEEIENFQKKIETIKFFLARATTEEEVKNAFTQLAEAKKNLKTLVETLREKLDAFKVIANNEQTKTDYKAIVAAYEKLSAKATEEDLEKVADYETVKNAYKNFFDAVDAGKDVIAYVNENLTGKTVIIGTSDETVTTAADKLQAFKNDYFSNETYNAYYGIVNEEGVGVLAEADVVANSLAMGAEINGYGKRLDLLKAAKAYATENILAEGKLVFNWNAYSGVAEVSDERPLYNNVANKALLDKIVAWSTDAAYKSDADFGTYTGCTADIEVENIKAILGADAYADLQTSVNYVAAMKDIYDNFTTVEETTLNVKTAILDEITKLISGDVVLNADNDAAMKALQALITELDAKIEAVENYNAADTNKLAMVSQAMRDNAKAYVDAYAAVVKAMNDVKAALTNTVEGVETIKFTSFTQYSMIDTFKTAVNTACDNLKTTLSATSVTAPEAINYIVDGDNTVLDENCLLAQLNALYNEFSKAAYEAWVAADEAISAVEKNGVKLDMGNQIRTAFDKITLATVTFGLKANDKIAPSANQEPVDFNALVDRLQDCLDEYEALATEAEVVAADLNTRIEAIADLSTTDLNNYKTITELMSDFNTKWMIDKFFTKDISVDDALAATQSVLKQGSVSETYKFVTTANYATLNEKYNAIVATYEAAKAVIEKWIADADAVMAEKMTIHTTAYNTVNEAWDNVVAFYTTLNADTQLFGEFTKHEAFVEKYNEYQTIVENATAAADEIRTAIDALPAFNEVTADNYTTVAAETARIYGLIETYNETYCNDDCQFAPNGDNNTSKKDYLLTLAKVAGVAEYLTETNEAGIDAAVIAKNLANLISGLNNENVKTVEEANSVVTFWVDKALGNA